VSYDNWVFDLDNTLYPASSSLFPQIDLRMRHFIAKALGIDLDAALTLQKQYYREYGTTLRGLMHVHGLAPDEFLAYVHEIDCTVLEPSPRLNAALARLPGRKFIFTNGSARHAENVLAQLELAGQFDGVFDIRSADFIPKPAIETYRRLLAQFAIEAKGAVMFEDLARNLVAAGELGMTTVWVRQDGHPDGAHDESDIAGIDHVTDDLAGWLESRLP
jgi:putative hydrolase of the HAD superfamily